MGETSNIAQRWNESVDVGVSARQTGCIRGARAPEAKAFSCENQRRSVGVTTLLRWLLLPRVSFERCRGGERRNKDRRESVDEEEKLAKCA